MDARLDAIRRVEYELSDEHPRPVLDEDRVGMGLRITGEGSSAFVVQEGSIDFDTAISQAQRCLASVQSLPLADSSGPIIVSPFELLPETMHTQLLVIESAREVLGVVRSALPTSRILFSRLIVQSGDRGVITSEGTLAVRDTTHCQLALNLEVASEAGQVLLPMTLAAPTPEGLIGRCRERLPGLRLAFAALSKATSFVKHPIRGPVVLSPWMAAVVLHEAFGHACEADRYRNLRELRRLHGIKLGPSGLCVTDDARSTHLTGALAFDDEGVPCRPVRLIEDGRWVGVLHSRDTAAIAGAELAGVARTTSYRFPPVCRSRITVVASGEVTEASLIASTSEGLYVDIPYGGHVRGAAFSVVAASAVRIRNGELAESIGPVVVEAAPLRVLKHVSGIADNITDVDADFCDRGKQRRLPVSMRTPSLRLEDVMVQPDLRSSLV